MCRPLFILPLLPISLNELQKVSSVEIQTKFILLYYLSTIPNPFNPITCIPSSKVFCSTKTVRSRFVILALLELSTIVRYLLHQRPTFVAKTMGLASKEVCLLRQLQQRPQCRMSLMRLAISQGCLATTCLDNSQSML